MNRTEALQRLFQRDPTIDAAMVRFAKINEWRGKAVWRIEIPHENLNPAESEHIHLLLYDQEPALLYHLEIPTSYLNAYKQKLAVRDDRDNMCFELATTRDSTMFHAVWPKEGVVTFRQFLKYCFGG